MSSAAAVAAAFVSSLVELVLQLTGQSGQVSALRGQQVACRRAIAGYRQRSIIPTCSPGSLVERAEHRGTGRSTGAPGGAQGHRAEHTGTGQ